MVEVWRSIVRMIVCSERRGEVKYRTKKRKHLKARIIATVHSNTITQCYL